MKQKNLKDIETSVQSKIFTADYTPDSPIEGIKQILLTNFPAEDGDLSEILRLTKNGGLEQFPSFKLAQINRVRHNVHAIKAWHVHLEQDELWYISPDAHLFVGLWDIRKNSKTTNQTMRIVLGGSASFLLLIPRGVAHGSANFSHATVDLYSLVNKHFDEKQPDELRIPWDAKGETFWQPLND